uniref:Uncharacterized protein n=1 Tax=Cannabis sativa TaxID=3483 RepID=A0A803PM34_CANSA
MLHQSLTQLKMMLKTEKDVYTVSKIEALLLAQEVRVHKGEQELDMSKPKEPHTTSQLMESICNGQEKILMGNETVAAPSCSNTSSNLSTSATHGQPFNLASASHQPQTQGVISCAAIPDTNKSTTTSISMPPTEMNGQTVITPSAQAPLSTQVQTVTASVDNVSAPLSTQV